MVAMRLQECNVKENTSEIITDLQFASKRIIHIRAPQIACSELAVEYARD